MGSPILSCIATSGAVGARQLLGSLQEKGLIVPFLQIRLRQAMSLLASSPAILQVQSSGLYIGQPGSKSHPWSTPCSTPAPLSSALPNFPESTQHQWGVNKYFTCVALPPLGRELCCSCSTGRKPLPPALDMPYSTFASPARSVHLYRPHWRDQDWALIDDKTGGKAAWLGSVPSPPNRWWQLIDWLFCRCVYRPPSCKNTRHGTVDGHLLLS